MMPREHFSFGGSQPQKGRGGHCVPRFDGHHRWPSLLPRQHVASSAVGLPDRDQYRDSRLLASACISKLGSLWGSAIDFDRGPLLNEEGRCSEQREAWSRWRLIATVRASAFLKVESAPPLVGHFLLKRYFVFAAGGGGGGVAFDGRAMGRY